MPKITFMPMNLTFDATTGESILDVAINHDVPICHACGGFCACTTCHVEVKSGQDHLSPMEDDEQERLETSATDVTLHSRLGCQARIEGDVVVLIKNLEEGH
jgi:2Fe-2S ferredoxin